MRSRDRKHKIIKPPPEAVRAHLTVRLSQQTCVRTFRVQDVAVRVGRLQDPPVVPFGEADSLACGRLERPCGRQPPLADHGALATTLLTYRFK